MILIHVDVDNLWIYEKEFGINLHRKREFIYNQSLPLLLNLLNKTNSKVTFMIVAKDLYLSTCQSFCRMAISQGHEIANHSFSHPISFASFSKEQKIEQITRAHQLITKICGKSPVGFRGPGYYQDNEIINILQKLNYRYDSSVLPGVAQFFMRAYAHFKGGENRIKTFGNKDYFLKQQNPYVISGLNTNKKLFELPISVLPFFRIPIHTTFAYFFGQMYRNLIISYLKTKPKYMLYLFHAIDFINLPKKSNNPIITLRYSHNERINFIKNLLDVMTKSNGGALKTTRDEIQTINNN